MSSYSVIDGDRDVLSSGETREDAIRNLDAVFCPSDLGCEDWEQVVSEWDKSDDGLGELMCVPSEEV